jgi:NAD(P)-dependent dehydrogenase (short-subunit alcohol dehydrogenase family)
MDGLKNKVVIVTGGAQGIGRGIAMQFLEAGASVVVADADAEALEEFRLERSSTPSVIHTVQCDVSSEDEVKKLVESALEQFGQIDFVINNAGIGINKPLETLDLFDWNRVIGVNLTGAFLMTKHASPHLRKTRGSIVNIASTRGIMSEANTEAYSASKGGLLALTHALAVSLGPDVRVNAVSPGWIETRDRQKKSAQTEVQYSDADLAQHPVGRVGTPEDIAAMVLFLCSSDAGFVTGQNFVVDGGMTKKMIYVE